MADATPPLQGLSRRFWICHVRDEQHETRTGGGIHHAILNAIHECDEEKAQAHSPELNDYLTNFALSTLRQGNDDWGFRKSAPDGNDFVSSSRSKRVRDTRYPVTVTWTNRWKRCFFAGYYGYAPKWVAGS